MSRQAAAEAAGMDRLTLRDRVHRFNADGIAGLADRPRSGRRTRLGLAGRRRLSHPPSMRAYETVREARSSISNYIGFYNSGRPHSSLDGRTPDEAYFGGRQMAEAA